MALQELHIHQFRNIESQRLAFSPSLNLIHGLNGSGKTSLLEAIYYLSSGRSFRTSKHNRVVREGSDRLTLFGRVREESGEHRLGIERVIGRQEATLHHNGLRVPTIAEFARLMPVSVIEPGTFDLVAGAPGYRRRFLDWLVFHVEHDYGRRWKACQRAIRQRNHLLRHGTISDQELGPWTEQVAAHGEDITRSRETGFELFRRELEQMMSNSEAGWARGLSVEFARGWDKSRSLGETLSGNPESERRAGFTLYGPNRADIRIRYGNLPAGEVLSRGQQRSLVILMKLAQMRVLRDRSGIRGVCLLDDINAELDAGNQQLLASELLALGCQLFVTSITSPGHEGPWSKVSAGDHRMFHVEHGQFAEQ